jgi:hypothetical protein
MLVGPNEVEIARLWMQLGLPRRCRGNPPHRVDQEKPCYVALHRMLFGSKDAAWARAGAHQRRPLHDRGQACGLYGRREEAAHDAVMP